MDRELTLHPEHEHNRGLVYSEYSSCDRSVHLLIQETPSVPYDVLLRVYRETVSAYLSSEEIRPPEDFIENLLSRFDGVAAEAGLPVDCWRTLGLHLLLRARSAFYVLTSRESDVLVRVDGRLDPVGAACGPARLRFDRGEIQRELFPSKLGELLTALKIDPSRMNGLDIVLGCAEADRSAVLDGLSNPLWLDAEAGSGLRASRRSMVSDAVSQRILVLRFGEESREAAPAVPAMKLPRFAFSRRLAAVVGVVVVASVGLAVLRWSGGRRSETPESVPRAQDGVSRVVPAPVPKTPRETENGRSSVWQLTEAWRRKLPAAVTSSPAVAGESVIFGCRDGFVYALDRFSGSPLWTFAASGGVGASPAIQGESVFVADYNGGVYAIAVSDGRQTWRTRLGTSVVSSPAVSGDRVLACGTDGYAYCLSAIDGRILWKERTKGRIRGSAIAEGGSFLVPSYDGFLYSFSAILGAVRWRAALGGPVSATPAARGGSVVIGGPDGKILCLGGADGSPKWNFTAGDAVKSSLAIAGHRVLAGSNNGCLYCLDLSTGALLWKYQTGGLVLGRPVETDGVVYVGSYDGRMYGLDAEDGRLLGAFETGNEIFSSPAADEERVYFGTNGGDFIALRRGREP
jgi:outer membrane protein assembly factor BamB